MTSGLYDWGRRGFLEGTIDWDSNDIRCVLVQISGTGTFYTVDLDNHDFLADVPAAARAGNGASGAFTSKTVDQPEGGVADAADVQLTGVTAPNTNQQVGAIIIYQHTGADDTARRLIAYIDAATGLPFTPSGGDVTIAWDSGANRIFKL